MASARRLRATAVVVVTLAVASPARAADPPAAARIAEIEREVQSVWHGMQRLTDEYLPKQGDTDRTLVHVARGELAWHTGDSLNAAVHLLKAIRQPGFHDHEAYPEAVYFLAEALFDLHIHSMARSLLERALATGARNRHYKEMLGRYLRIAWDDHDPAKLDAWVQVYRHQWMGRPRMDEHDSEVRYYLGKVYIHRKLPALARRVLEGIAQDDPYRARAAYLSGVTLVMEERLDEATAVFEAVARSAGAEARRLSGERLAAVRGADGKQGPKPKVVKEVRRPGREARALREVWKETELAWEQAEPASEEEAISRDVAREAALSRARLAMVLEDWPAAWRWYRWVPPGSPEHREVLDEAVWCLLRRREFDMAERVTEQIIAGSEAGRSAGLARVLRAHLMAEAGRFEDAERGFAETMEHLQQVLPDIARAGAGLTISDEGEVRFDPRVVAWTDPVELGAARQRVELLNSRVADVAATRALITTLSDYVQDPARMPAVREAHVRADAMRKRIEALRARTGEARQSAGGGGGGTASLPPAGSGGGWTGPLLQRLAVAESWLVRMDRHLSAVLGAIEQDAARQAQEIRGALDEERVRIQWYEAEVATLQDTALSAARSLAAGAQSRVRDLALKAELGLTEVSYKRKEELTRRIDEMYAEMKQAQQDWALTRRRVDQTQVRTTREVAYPPGLEGVRRPDDEK